METAVIDSPRGKWTMSRAHNPVQDMYLRVVEKGDNKVLGVAQKAVIRPPGASWVEPPEALTRLPLLLRKGDDTSGRRRSGHGAMACSAAF